MLKVYLRPDVKFEPLIWQWYAWSYLIPPQCGSAYLTKRYLRLLKSFLKHPELHSRASKDSNLVGGFFVDLEETKQLNIEKLILETEMQLQSLISLAKDISVLNNLLREKAIGISLDEIYSLIPDSLQGMIELVYDLNNNPHVRFIETLLYQRHYSSAMQRIALSSTVEDNRPFTLSTPRLETDKDIHLSLPFHDDVVDMLAQAREKLIDFNWLKKKINIDSKKELFFRDLFTELAPPLSVNRHYSENKLRIRYFGHACILLQSENFSILIDPLISYSTNGETSRFSYYDLPEKIDAILITHNHQDHISLETLLQLRYKTETIYVPKNNSQCLADPSLKLILNNIGFNNVISIDEFEDFKIGNIKITPIPFFGEHGDLNIQTKLAYHVNMNNTSILFAVDSNNIDNNFYKQIKQFLGPITVLFIGMECKGAPYSWTYGPLIPDSIVKEHDQSRRLCGSDCDRAWQMIQELDCKEVVIYAMGQEPWLTHILGMAASENSLPIKESNKLLSLCKERGIHATRPFGLQEWIYH